MRQEIVAMENEQMKQESKSGIDSSRRAVRRLIYKLLPTDELFDAYCSDYHQDSYTHFSSGMDRNQKITILLNEVHIDLILKSLSECNLARNEKSKLLTKRKNGKMFVSSKGKLHSYRRFIMGALIYDYIKKSWSSISNFWTNLSILITKAWDWVVQAAGGSQIAASAATTCAAIGLAATAVTVSSELGNIRQEKNQDSSHTARKRRSTRFVTDSLKNNKKIFENPIIPDMLSLSNYQQDASTPDVDSGIVTVRDNTYRKKSDSRIVAEEDICKIRKLGSGADVWVPADDCGLDAARDYVEAGRAEIEKGNYDGGFILCRKSTGNPVMRAAAITCMGQAEYLLGKYDRGIHWGCLAMDGTGFPAIPVYLLLAHSFYKLKDCHNAQEYAERLLAIDEENHDAKYISSKCTPPLP